MKAKCQGWPVAPSLAQGSMWKRRGPVSHHVVRMQRPSFPPHSLGWSNLERVKEEKAVGRRGRRRR